MMKANRPDPTRKQSSFFRRLGVLGVFLLALLLSATGLAGAFTGPVDPVSDVAASPGSPGESAGSGQALCEERQPHPVIQIHEDHGPQGFTWDDPQSGDPVLRPGSGVVGGSGTAGDPFRIEGWCITPQGEDEPRGIDIEGTTAHLVVQDNAILGTDPESLAAAVRVQQAGPVVLASNRVHSSQLGIQVSFSDGVRVEGNTVTGTSGTGINVGQSLDAVVQDNLVEAAGSNGISVGVSDNALVKGNRALDGSSGLSIVFSDDVVVEGNEAVGNEVDGIVVYGAHDVVVIGNTARGNLNGIVIDQNERASATGNTVEDNHNEGIIFWGSSESLATGNLLVNNGHSDARAGLRFASSFDATAIGNTAEGNAVGIVFDGVQDVVAEENEATGNSEDGLAVYFGVSARLEDNRITGNGHDAMGSGLYILENDQVVLQGNQVTGNNEGARIENTPGLFAKANAIANNDGHGILLQDTTDSHLLENLFNRNAVGVVVEGDNPGLRLETNDIQSSTSGTGLDTRGSLSVVDARDNWWGCPEGPGAEGCDAVKHSPLFDVLSDPWLAAPIWAGPSADFSFSPQDPVAGQGVQFLDESVGADAEIVAWSWSFSDGASSNERDPSRSFADPATYTVSLTVEDAHGLTHKATKNLQVSPAPDAPETLNLQRTGGGPPALSPGDTFTLSAKLRHVGEAHVEVFFETQVPAGWQGETLNGTFGLHPGETLDVPVHLTVGAVDGTERVRLLAHVVGAPGATKQVDWLLEAPLFLDIQMTNTTSGSTITGEITLRYANGEGVEGVLITGARTNGWDITGALRTPLRGTTNENGWFSFSFPPSHTMAQIPGTHVIHVEAWTDEAYHRGHTSYRVDLL